MTRTAGLACGAVILAALLAGSGAVRAQQPRSEYEVKAAYLYSFGRFVEWPGRAPGRDARFGVCVLGADPFGSALDAMLEGVTVRGLAAMAQRVSSSSEAAACHILFIGASEDRQLETIVEALAGVDVLTVSDMPMFLERGGMIEFVLSDDRVRFEIDLSSAARAGLVMSSELLRVAASVRRAEN